MRNLIAYHAGTGTIIPLSDHLYLFDADLLTEQQVADMGAGMSNREAYRMGGVELDNYNLTNLFFGGAQ